MNYSISRTSRTNLCIWRTTQYREIHRTIRNISLRINCLIPSFRGTLTILTLPKIIILNRVLCRSWSRWLIMLLRPIIRFWIIKGIRIIFRFLDLILWLTGILSLGSSRSTITPVFKSTVLFFKELFLSCWNIPLGWDSIPYFLLLVTFLWANVSIFQTTTLRIWSTSWYLMKEACVVQ